MTTISALELIRAHRWSRLFFTTYALSLSFFESVILDVIVRQDIRSATILADISGVRAAMEEFGAQGAGRLYDIEPVAVKNGCFHPKLLALTSETESHLIIGSGNLTFGGWGSNLECVEHLHQSFAADAFDDAARFLEALAETENLSYAAQNECTDIARVLKRSVTGAVRNGNIRLLNSLGISILDQLVALTKELGGAKRVVIVSPFFGGIGVDTICARLGIDHAFVHAHDGGTVIGFAGSNWPNGALNTVKPVILDVLRESKPRLLHAKMFEVICSKGRVVLSGSANATMAGLGPGHNIELCVARVERTAVTGWRFSKADAPPPTVLQEADEEETAPSLAVLRATLLGGDLHGAVMGHFPEGAAAGFRREGADWKIVGSTIVATNGTFDIKAEDLRQTVWSGQLVLRLVAENGKLAQGFVSLPEAREIARRLGSTAPNFFGFLQGKETPDDIAAIMSYFYEHPDSLPAGGSGSWGQTGATGGEDKPDPNVNVDKLLVPGGSGSSAGHAKGQSSDAWVAFIQKVFAAFSEPRGPIESDPSENDDSNDDRKDKPPGPLSKRKASITYATLSFEKLLEKRLAAPPEKRDTVDALRMTQYVCDRLTLETFRVKGYLDRLVESFAQSPSKLNELPLAAAAILLWGMQLEHGSEVAAANELRRALLHAGVTLPGKLPDLALVGGLIRRLPSRVEPSALWDRVCTSLTAQEEARMLARARGIPLDDDFPLLRATPEWQVLSQGMASSIIVMPQLLDYCQYCYMKLSSVETNRLRETATCAHSCGRILLCVEV